MEKKGIGMEKGEVEKNFGMFNGGLRARRGVLGVQSFMKHSKKLHW